MEWYSDPPTRARQHGVTLTEAFKHFVKFVERLPKVSTGGGFLHTQGSRYELRHQLLSQANVYLRQHPADANMTLEQLSAMVNSKSAKQMVYRLQCVKSQQGTNQYWYQRLQEVLTLVEQKGCPTFFFTVSAAESYTTGQSYKVFCRMRKMLHGRNEGKPLLTIQI